MPGHAILAVAVEIEAGGVEDQAVTRREREADVFEDSRLQRNARAEVPGRRQSRFEDTPIVHAAAALPPFAAVDHLAEEGVRAAHPTRNEVDPDLRVEPGPRQGADVCTD